MSTQEPACIHCLQILFLKYIRKCVCLGETSSFILLPYKQPDKERININSSTKQCKNIHLKK